MASEKWQPLAAQFRSFLPLLRALVRDENLADECDRVQSVMDDIVGWFRDELYSELQDELNAASDPDDTTGPVAPPPAGDGLETYIETVVGQLEDLLAQVEALAEEDSDGDGGE